MKRTTIMLPEEIKKRAEQISREQGVSLAELIRLSLLMYMKPKTSKNLKDSLLSDSEVYTKPVPEDISENHDKYLYGDEQ